MYGAVVATRRLSPHLVRIVLGGPGLADFRPASDADAYVNCFFTPDDAPYSVPFDDADHRDLPRDQRPHPRRITVRRWDADRRELTLDIASHGDAGYAGRWAGRAQVGDLLQFRGPAGDYTPPEEAEAYLLVGDESALPAIATCAEAVPAGRPVWVIAEVEAPGHEIELESPGALTVHWVYRTGHEERLERLLADEVAAGVVPDGRLSAFVHGEAEATRAVRRELLRRRLVSPDFLSCSPYWKRGHDDESWRAIKGAWVRAMNAELSGDPEEDAGR